MAAATRQKVRPDSPEDERYLLASELVRRWRTLTGLANDEIAEKAGLDPATVSTAASGRRVREETWVLIGDALNWGGFLDYVMRGDIGAVSRCDFVDDRIRIYAIESLQGIADRTQ